MIPNYRLSGATTEVNSECYAALQTVSHMARVLGKHADGAFFKGAAEALREAINAHLLDSESHLYYLNIELDGTKRSDCTSDMVFPLMFGVADDETAARIIARLSREEFWTAAGIRTVPANGRELRTDPRVWLARGRMDRRELLVCFCRCALQSGSHGAFLVGCV